MWLQSEEFTRPATPIAIVVTLLTVFGFLFRNTIGAWRDRRRAKRQAARDQAQDDKIDAVHATAAENTESIEEIKAMVAQIHRHQGLSQAASGLQTEELTEAVTAAAQGAEAGDPRMTQALHWLETGDTGAAADLFRQVAVDLDAKIAADKAASAAAWRHVGAIARYTDPKAAWEAYQRAVDLDPTNWDAQLILGQLHLSTTGLAAARAAYEAVLAAGNQGVEDRQTAWARLGLGDVLVAQGQLEQALESYQAGLKIAERLAELDPSNTEWQRDLSVSHNRIGDVQGTQGGLAAAQASYQAGLEIQQRLAASDPSNTLWQRDLSISHNKIGDVQVAQGRLEAAQASYQAGLEIAERLAASDPSNTRWQRDWAVSLGQVGMVLGALGSSDEANDYLSRGRAIIARLIEGSPTDATLPKDLALFDQELAKLAGVQDPSRIPAPSPSSA